MPHVRDVITLHSMMLTLSKIEAAIILKIWRNSFSRRLSWFVIRVVAESGLLYTLTTIATFCTLFLNHSTAFAVTSAIVCHNEIAPGIISHHAPRVFPLL